MSSKGPQFQNTKISNNNGNRTKMFKIERKVPNYKPRFYTNKNLFFVRNIKKNNSKYYNKKFKLKFLKNRQKILSKRELRNKHGLFITHHNKPSINSNCETSPNKLTKLKRKLKFKFSVINQSKQQELKKEKINIENNINISLSNNEILFSNEETKNLTIVNELIKKNLTNNNISSINSITQIKKQKIISNKNSKYSTGRWTLDEHKKFIQAIITYGNDWKEVQKHIGTRSSSQARSHAQKFFIKLKEDQSNSKISNMIDYSNPSIKTFHDTFQSLSPDKKEKIIQEMENVTFDKQISNKKRKRSKSHINNNYSESNTEMGFISGTDYFESITLNEDKNNNRKMSVDSLSEENKFDKRKFIELQHNANGMFTDEEYEKSFHKVFSDKEKDVDLDIEVESRKQSIEEDFICEKLITFNELHLLSI